MNVTVQNLQSGGGAGVATRFSDNFNRALLGNNWYTTYGVSGFLGADAAAFQMTTTLAANALAVQNTGAGGNPCNCTLIPVPIFNARVRGKTQFSQARYVSSSSIISQRMGPAVLQISPNSKNAGGIDGYHLSTNAVAGQLLLRRSDPPAATILVNPFITGFAFGDTIKLSADVSTPGSVTLRGSLNGVVVATFVDVAPTVPAGDGYPMIFILGMSPGVPDTWDDYLGGIGLG